MKKKGFALIISSLLAAALLCGCGGGGEEGTSGGSSAADGSGQAAGAVVEIARNGQTDFVIVNHLSDDEAAREYMTDLTIKTGAQFKLADAAPEGGKAIHIGTAAQLAGLGGTDPGITYTQYELAADDGGLYISLGAEEFAKEVSSVLRNEITKQADGSFVLPAESLGGRNVCAISETVPEFETASGEITDVHDCGSDNYQIIYSGMDKASADAEIAAYEQKLKDAGYTLFQENDIMNNRFTTFTKGDTLVHCNYFYAMHEFRLVYGKLRYLGPEAAVTDFEKKAEPSVSEIGMSASVQCNVIQLADGSFVVIDGGWGTSTPLTYSYTNDAGEKVEQSYYRDYEADMAALWDFLVRKTPEGEKPQVTWMITHADPDHICLFPPFVKLHSDEFDLKTIVYNFPNLYNIGLGSGNSTNDPTTFTGYIDAFLNTADTYFPDVQHYVYHTGQVLHLPGCELEFLFAQEDFWPHEMAWMNATSGAWRFNFTDSGKNALFLGDCEQGLNNQMAQVFGSYMKSDIFQPAHHGSNGGTLALYKQVDPEVCFWTCADFPFYNDNRHTGTKEGWDFNAFLRNSDKIKYHFTNSADHTLIVATMEEEK